MKKYFSVLFIVLITSFMFSMPANSKEVKNAQLEKAKTFKKGTNLGMIAMHYSNIVACDAKDVGFLAYEFYQKTGKSNDVIRIWLMNLSNKVIEVNPINFKVVTEKGYTVPIHNYTYRTKNSFPVTSLEPETKTDGFVVFGLEMEDSILKIIYDDRMGNRVSGEYIDSKLLEIYERSFSRDSPFFSMQELLRNK